METTDVKITFEELGITKAPKLADTHLGKRRAVKDINKKEIIFSVIACLSLLAAFILSVIRLAELDRNNNTKDPDFTFALIIIINTVFCVYYVLNGIFAERPYEILVFVTATCIVWIYIIVNYALTPTTIKLIRLIISCVLSPALIVIGVILVKAYNDSGRLIFRTVGANIDLQRMCKTMFAYFGLLKFDLQLGLSMVILILTNGSEVNLKDKIILTIGAIVTVVCFLIGYLCVRWENKPMAYIFGVSLLLQPAYVLYIIIQTAQNLSTGHKALVATTFTCGALSLIIRITVMVFLVWTYSNFGYGLAEKVFPLSEHRVVNDGSNIKGNIVDTGGAKHDEPADPSVQGRQPDSVITSIPGQDHL